MPDTGFGLSLHRNEFTGSRLKHGCFCLTMSGFVFESLGGKVGRCEEKAWLARPPQSAERGWVLALLAGRSLSPSLGCG